MSTPSPTSLPQTSLLRASSRTARAQFHSSVVAKVGRAPKSLNAPLFHRSRTGPSVAATTEWTNPGQCIRKGAKRFMSHTAL
ncbi:hypothetical protein FEZ60_04685 [Rhodococcus sp. MS16]|nr:hypothetical protein [Rhodococcus sp. MS16]